MRWAAFARQAFAGDDLQPGRACESAEFVDTEAQVAMLERLDRRAMRVPTERCREQAATLAQHARTFGDDRR